MEDPVFETQITHPKIPYYLRLANASLLHVASILEFAQGRASKDL